MEWAKKITTTNYIFIIRTGHYFRHVTCDYAFKLHKISKRSQALSPFHLQRRTKRHRKPSHLFSFSQLVSKIQKQKWGAWGEPHLAVFKTLSSRIPLDGAQRTICSAKNWTQVGHTHCISLTHCTIPATLITEVKSKYQALKLRLIINNSFAP